MGVITSRCEGISSLLYGMGYSSEILMKSMGYSYFYFEGELVSLHRDVPPEERGGQYVEIPHNNPVGFSSYVVRCLLSSIKS
jgi:hypothetical protein